MSQCMLACPTVSRCALHSQFFLACVSCSKAPTHMRRCHRCERAAVLMQMQVRCCIWLHHVAPFMCPMCTAADTWTSYQGWSLKQMEGQLPALMQQPIARKSSSSQLLASQGADACSFLSQPASHDIGQHAAARGNLLWLPSSHGSLLTMRSPQPAKQGFPSAAARQPHPPTHTAEQLS
jgi:hypothetical protein